MTDAKFIAGAIFFIFFELILFGMIAANNAAIQCPNLPEVNQGDAIGWIISSIGLFFSPCSGLPIWAYVLIFVPLAIVIIINVTPFIG